MWEQAFGLDRFGVSGRGRGSEMIKSLLIAMGLGGLMAVTVVEGAVAVPITPVIAEIAAPPGRSVEPAYYYYHGRRAMSK
jgi:hypothetical protein